MTFIERQLRPHQSDFLDGFLSGHDQRALLVAAPGTGKSLTALVAATRMLNQRLVDRVLFVAADRVTAEQWRRVLPKNKLSWFERSAGTITGVTTYSMLSQAAERTWKDVPSETKWLFIFDDISWAATRLEAIASDALLRFPASRALFMSTSVPSISVDKRFSFDTEYFSQDALAEATTQSGLIQLAPSFGILQKIQNKLVDLDNLGWRDFEKLIAHLLETDGYNVELMQGSKDDGIDVVATRDLGDAGLFKSLWQAKKYRLDRKVGLSLVREMADVRADYKASKAIIVTTSYLTSGALDRVKRDRFQLGKVDRTDLDKWVERTLRGKS